MKHKGGKLNTPFDVVMIGAGIVGLATVRELQSRHPGLRIAIVDKELSPGQHQSGHNSGVLHSGVYYQPGSLKARLCVEGKTRMERFAREHGIDYEICGKLIVALSEDELGRLGDIEARGRANGVQDMRMVGPEEMREIEPHAVGVRALHLPHTGIIDFSQVVTTLARLLDREGVTLLFGHEVLGVEDRAGVQVLRTTQGEITTRKVISCSGLHSDRVASFDSQPDVQIVPFRGDYYTLRLEARHLCRGLIYPVPDPSLPFLGVHFTKRVDGAVWAGPNAVLATKREGYSRLGFDWRDLLETVRYPGLRKLARSYWRTGAAEVWRDAVKAAFVKDLQRYVPSIKGNQLTFGPAGVRAQAVALDGSMVDDFKLAFSGKSLHVLNAPSPGATASLAIAGHLANEAGKAFGMTPSRIAHGPQTGTAAGPISWDGP